MGKKALGNILLTLTAMIWGLAFVAQKKGIELLGPFTFNGIRFLLGALVLIPVVLISIKAMGKTLQKKDSLLGGLFCGIALFAGSSLQQIGLIYTTAGKGGFVTAFYIVLVPVIGIIIGKKIRPILWVCVVIALAGLYFICIKEDFTVNKGDILVLASAFCYAIHILVIDHFTPKVNGVLLSCLQFFVVGIISIPCMAVFETVDLDSILASWLPICYAGVMASGVGYTLQIIAQKYTEPTVASLLMSLESVFAVLGGWIILNEMLSVKEFIGCAVMFIAITLSQLPPKNQPAALDR